MYQLNNTKFISERFDEETVLVDVQDGYYYSLSDSGTEILDSLEKGLAVDEIASLLAGDAGDQPEWQTTVASFIERLSKESIIIPRAESAACETVTAGKQHAPRGSAGPVAAPPVLTRYEDMRDILLLDPVHLVDQERGWPHR